MTHSKIKIVLVRETTYSYSVPSRDQVPNTGEIKVKIGARIKFRSRCPPLELKATYPGEQIMSDPV